MKIAVCMSGQLRNWEIAKDNQKWFWSTSNEEVDYFIHTWNYSGDRRGVSQEYEWRDVTKKEFNKIVKWYDIKKSIYDTKEQKYFYGNDHWSALFYSFAQSVMLKRQYEIENNFEYVEENFSQKVREIYYDKKSKKAIYGSATPKEREELEEEGIDLLSVPWVRKNN